MTYTAIALGIYLSFILWAVFAVCRAALRANPPATEATDPVTAHLKRAAMARYGEHGEDFLAWEREVLA